MMTKPVIANQSMQDVIIMACGSMEAGMAFCALNDVAISDLPVVGAVYQIPPFGAAPDDSLIQSSSDQADNGVLQYLGQYGIVMGTLGNAPMEVYGGEDGT